LGITVAFEGLPGCGKSTVIKALTDKLQGLGFKVEKTDVETTGHAPTLRSVARTFPQDHPASMLIFWSLRLQQYEAMEGLRQKADVVFADRFWGTTVVVDFYGNDVPQEILKWVGANMEKKPDITIFLDVPLSVALQRKESKTMGDPEFANRIERGYAELSEKLGWIRIDATQSPDTVMKQCFQVILSKL